MFRVFNMGIGFLVVVRPDKAREAVNILVDQGEDARIIGEIIPGDGRVEFQGGCKNCAWSCWFRGGGGAPTSRPSSMRSRGGRLDAEVAAVISDSPDAYAEARREGACSRVLH